MGALDKPRDVAFGDLLSDPQGTLVDVDTQPVRVLRDHGKRDLLVMRADQARRNAELLDALIALLEAHVEGGQAGAIAAVPAVLPWADVLPRVDHEMLVAEFLRVTQYRDSKARVNALDVLWEQWEETAAAQRDETMLEAHRAPIVDQGPVTC
ncbi:MAG: hypothetical protein ITG02_03110 [Patulibacter sp.]|nr:hypothetical protein [Patulibacter sp.]